MSSSNYSLILRMTHVLNAKLMVRGRLEAGDITGKSQNRYFRVIHQNLRSSRSLFTLRTLFLRAPHKPFGSALKEIFLMLKINSRWY